MRVKQFMGKQGVGYDVLPHKPVDNYEQALLAADVAPELAVTSQVLIDEQGVAVAVYPYAAELDLDALNDTAGRSFRLLGDDKAQRLFPDCERGALPPLGAAYRLPVWVDEQLFDTDTLFMQSGTHRALLKLDGRSFRLTMSGANKSDFSIWPEGSRQYFGEGINACQGNMTLDAVARKLQRLHRLPPMPDVAVRILHMVSDPDVGVGELAEVIERDPSLAAQIMRYAGSALFNYQGEIRNVRDAVNIVLGFDRVAHIAMGIAASKAFDIPREGALGLDAFWTHSLHCSFLCQQFARALDPEREIDTGLAYLAGLLHNFGMLLIGHLYPTEFGVLDKLVEENPEAELSQLERQVFGKGSSRDMIAVGHGAVGGVLLRLWQLPEPVVKTAGMHQQKDYQGEFADYVTLVQLANAVLKQHGIGDEMTQEPLEPYFDRLGLSTEQGESIIAAAMAESDGIQQLARTMAA